MHDRVGVAIIVRLSWNWMFESQAETGQQHNPLGKQQANFGHLDLSN